jgi:hypothetical protein
MRTGESLPCRAVMPLHEQGCTMECRILTDGGRVQEYGPRGLLPGYIRTIKNEDSSSR